jgi:uncharacterized protein YdeI (YjbR/CyaY-like superfamily)
VTWKKGRGPYVSAAEIAEEALCFGWIDSLPRALDADRTMLRVSPRKPGSAWSKLNRDRVARLTAAGLIAPPGAAAIARAKADGSWSRVAAADALEPPPALLVAFARHPGAAERFCGFPPSARRAILEWILQAKRADTRAQRVETAAAAAARGERANAWRRPR